MYDFIHSLPTSTIIATCDGEIIDVNKWTLKDCNAESKLKMLNRSVFDFSVDKSKFKQGIDFLYDGNIIQNQKVLLKAMDGRIVEKTTDITLLCREKGLILFQNHGSIECSFPLIDRAKVLLVDLRKLLPYLNKAGKDLLDQICDTQKHQLEKCYELARVKYISQQLTEQFPELTNAELYLCSLILLGFSTREITSLGGFTSNAIRVNIYRLCQKYGVSSRDELFLLLKSTINMHESSFVLS